MTQINGYVMALGVVCITALEAYALYLGHNGIILTTVIGIIAGVIGFNAKDFLSLAKK